jgi:thioredoxin reductase (NADPH)
MNDKEFPAAPAAANHPRKQQMFPVLNEAQVNILSSYGSRRMYPAGSVLFAEGERHIPMFVIVSGEIAIERQTVDGPQAIIVYEAGAFSGEINVLAGRASMTTGRAVRDSEVVVIDEAALRTLVVSEAELSETIMRAFILRRVALIEDQHGGVVLVGSRHNADTLRLREFLIRNGQPVAYFDLEQHADIATLLERFRIKPSDIPVVVSSQGQVLRNPSNRMTADVIGLSPDRLDGKSFDVIVVGAGPAGLAAAVYAASEGLSVAVLDAKAPGGQAGTSSKIENYFGFPTGISGQALAGRGLSQARKFGAEVAVPVEVRRLECATHRCKERHRYTIELDNGDHVHARTVIIATGARYRKPALDQLESFEGRGIYYGASFMEATLCAHEEIIVVGGGNSAGQAAVFLAGHASHVHVMVRGTGLAASMSHYLIQRLDAAPNITLHAETEIVELLGDGSLQGVRFRRHGHEVEERDIAHVFLFLGAEPNTGWLGDCVALDSKGFVLTGPALPADAWQGECPPYFLETSRPGIFAVGDVRSNSVKRVATAVGEGAAAIQSLHEVLSG